MLCLLIGGGIGLMLPSGDRQKTQTGSAPQQRVPKHRTSTADRIQAVIDREQRYRASFTKVTVRENALQCIEDTPAQLAEDRKRYAGWLAAAKRMEKTSDLGRELTQALGSKDEDQIGVVMVAWFLRNPTEAFDQFRIRPALIDTFINRSPLWHAVNLAEMKAFAQGTTMPEEIRNYILMRYSGHLADFGKLDAFLELLSSLEEYEARDLVGHFSTVWLPVDPQASAATIHRHLDSPAMALLMNEMLVGVPNPKPLWTEAFGKALLAKPLGALEPLRAEIEGELERIDNSLGDRFYFQRDDAVLLEQAEFPDSMGQVMGIHLNHDAGWVDRFARGECGILEIETMLTSRIPQAANHPADFHRSKLDHLWIHQPVQTIAWARQRMSGEEIAKALSGGLKGLLEPRASRLQVLLASLEGLEFTDEEAIKWIDQSMARVEKWQHHHTTQEASGK